MPIPAIVLIRHCCACCHSDHTYEGRDNESIVRSEPAKHKDANIEPQEDRCRSQSDEEAHNSDEFRASPRRICIVGDRPIGYDLDGYVADHLVVCARS